MAERAVPGLGIHHGIPYAVYSSWGGQRFSNLKHFDDTEAHAFLRIRSLSKDKKALVMGRAFHVAALEPELLEQQFAMVPRVMVKGVMTSDGRLKPVQAARAELAASRPEAEILSAPDYEDILSWRDAIWGDPLMSEILSAPGFNEASILWEDMATGLVCKARLDAMRLWSGYTLVIDLKSAENASPSGMTKACCDWHYPAQAAHYMNGLYALAPAERRFMFFAVEKGTSLPAVYEPDYATLEYGRRQVARWMAKAKRCQETGKWPGYPAGINPLSLPEWKFREEEEDDDSTRI